MRTLLRTLFFAAAALTFSVPEAPAADGKKIYTSYCQTCHQANGQGITGIYPPLARADNLKNTNKTIQSLIFGLSGPITVNGKKYNGTMPPAAQYKDDEIAAVLSYVRSSFGNNLPAVTPADVAKVRKAGKTAKY